MKSAASGRFDRAALIVFVAFASAYFFSTLLRAVTATLAPAFSAELGLSASGLGLLAGAYFIGFAALQLPMGAALDRYGPKRVQLVLMSVAVGACIGFALAQSLGALVVARALIGVGVASCLMAPLTYFRQVLGPELQLRVSSWMLMTGSLGMLSSTLPVHALMPIWGWRGLFWAMALGLALAMLLILWRVPAVVPRLAEAAAQAIPPRPDAAPGAELGYRHVFKNPVFLRLAPLGLWHYGGMVAVQTLWAGPWMTRVTGASAEAAAGGLFGLNLAMLVAFALLGTWAPRWAARGWTTERLVGLVAPLSTVILIGVVALGERAGAVAWTLWCLSCVVLTLTQPAIAQGFPAQLAGRALSAYNLVIFTGVFTVQWGLGLLIDAAGAAGLGPVAAHQVAFGVFAAGCVLSNGWYHLHRDQSGVSVLDAATAAPGVGPKR